MMHVQIIDGAIVATRATPTGGAWEDDQWLDFTDPTVLAAWEARHGWTLVVETPQPQDTDTVKHDESVVLVDGAPTQTWTARPWTQAELAAQAKEKAREAARVEREATRAKVKAIIADLQAEKVRAQAVIDKTNASITGADTKDVARAAKRIADSAIDLARFVQDQ